MWLIAGLGNPGQEYALNRHNIGFMAVDVLAQNYNFPAWKKKFNALISQGEIDDKKILLVKPMTYMNNSGHAVSAAAQFFKVPAEKSLVIYDELDLLPNKVRIKQNGGSGGHNGIKSIDSSALGKNYWRMRLGIGHPGDKSKVTSYVLGNFSKNEMQSLPDFLGALSDHMPFMLQGDEATFMNKITNDINLNGDI